MGESASGTGRQNDAPAPDPALAAGAGHRDKPSAWQEGVRFLGPIVAAGFTFLLTEGVARVEATALTLVALLAGTLVTGRDPSWSHLLPFMRVVARLAGPALGAVVLVIFLRLYGDLGRITYAELAVVVAVNTTVSLFAERFANRLFTPDHRLRVALIGSAWTADTLDREMKLANVRDYTMVGRVTPSASPSDHGEIEILGSLGQLAEIVERHDIGLLLMASDVPRLTVFDEFTHTCMHTDVRLTELSIFYEEVFGHVPVADINSAWFQRLMHMRSRGTQPRAERIRDVALALGMGVVAVPLITALAWFIKRDGGPLFFRQVRIGEQGRPFTIVKLRTMRLDASSAWAHADDDRVTRLGRFLRRSHLDELPQLLNVLRGEMSIVGPRPEQPEFVNHLERLVPYYTRRHLMKPGLTGWAQVRCGYAGSDTGSAWKVAHDLYYLKHRTFMLDLVILGETVRAVGGNMQYSAEPSSVEFILAPVTKATTKDPLAPDAHSGASDVDGINVLPHLG